MISETVTHFYWEGDSLDVEFQDVKGLLLFPISAILFSYEFSHERF